MSPTLKPRCVPWLSSLWELGEGDDALEILLPMDPQLGVYALRTGDLLQTLAVVEPISINAENADVPDARIPEWAAGDTEHRWQPGVYW